MGGSQRGSRRKRRGRRGREMANAGATLAAPLLAGANCESLSRDLEAARTAFISGSADASRLSHQTGANNHATEAHDQSGGSIKAIVFGGLDGILTSFAIVAGAV